MKKLRTKQTVFKKCIAKCSKHISIEDNGMLCVMTVIDPKGGNMIRVPIDLKTAEKMWLALDEWMNT